MEYTHFQIMPKFSRKRPAPCSTLHASRAFTLIELLVVITIIGILAALITVAAVGALKNAQRTRTKAELNQLANAVDESKNKTTVYPPNCQTDDNTIGGTAGPLDEATVFNDMKRYMRTAFPRNQESDNLLRMLLGLQRDSSASDASSYTRSPLSGGMTAGEGLVFWLGPFSQDPKYPISGDGGPSYVIQNYGQTTNRTLDQPESRGKGGSYPFDVTRLGQRATDGFFDESNARFVEYTDPKGQKRRINFWQYMPAKSDQPYLYFDTSRHPVGTISGSNLIGTFDPPAATSWGANREPISVYAFKKANESAATGQPPIQFINPDKFQIIHCGLPNTWDTDNFLKMAPRGGMPLNSPFLLFPTGPFTGDIAEAIVNFTTETKIEDAQK